MNYEQKYKDALERAKTLYENANGMLHKRWVKQVFPELQKSEDERIKHEINVILTNTDLSQFALDYTFADMIAWLEKQGKIIDEYEDKLDRCACESFDKGYKAALEKQGEQNKINSCKFTCEDILALECSMNLAKITEGGEQLYQILVPLYDKIHNAYLLQLQGEQKSDDKVEPKFHKGEWIVWQNKCYKVNYNGCGYELIDPNGLRTSLEYGTVDSSGHLWTINDAKDGDVLSCENGWTCIFKVLDNHTNTFSSYCFMDKEGWFCENGGQAHTLSNRICGEIHPSTKEQRDILFQKMKEAGYEWDTEKKELKKIEQTLTWSEEDERMINSIIKNLDEAEWFDIYQADWLRTLKERLKGE